jgi:hypothetical protein
MIQDIVDKGYPFALYCRKCEIHYEGCFNDQPCPKCKENESIRWTLKAGFDKEVPDPHNCTIKNFKFNIVGSVSL